MKIAAYVPIKLNNTRTPGKNLKKLSDGTPLCKLIFNTLSSINGIDEKYCFCSSEEIKSYLNDDIIFLKRDKKLDENETKCHDIIKSFIGIVNPDIIVMMHATSPFITKETVELCINKVKSGEYDSAFTVEQRHDLLWKNGKPFNFNPIVGPRTQDLDLIYKETNGLFVFTKEVFEKTGQRVGNNPFFCELGFPEYQDVNYPEDFVVTDLIYTNVIKKVKVNGKTH